jgi:hypothetical protein
MGRMLAPRAVGEGSAPNELQVGVGKETMAIDALSKRTDDVYQSFIEVVNRQDLDAAAQLLDPQRYRENCVGRGVGLDQSTPSTMRARTLAATDAAK